MKHGDVRMRAFYRYVQRRWVTKVSGVIVQTTIAIPIHGPAPAVCARYDTRPVKMAPPSETAANRQTFLSRSEYEKLQSVFTRYDQHVAHANAIVFANVDDAPACDISATATTICRPVASIPQTPKRTILMNSVLFVMAVSLHRQHGKQRHATRQRAM